MAPSSNSLHPEPRVDWQTVINLGAATLLAWVGYQYREAKQDIKDNAIAIAGLALRMAQEYVTHNDLLRIENTLIRIEAKLDGKADK